MVIPNYQIIELWYIHCTGAVPQYGAFYGESSKPVLLTALSCSGTEQGLLSCSGSTFGITECGNYEEAGVICRGKFEIIHMLQVHNVYIAHGNRV